MKDSGNPIPTIFREDRLEVRVTQAALCDLGRHSFRYWAFLVLVVKFTLHGEQKDMFLPMEHIDFADRCCRDGVRQKLR